MSGWTISHEMSPADIDVAFRWISEDSYWAKRIPRDLFERSVAHSLCFALHDGAGVLKGFARVITDRATFAYLCDVFVDPTMRGQGVGKALMEAAMDHPELQNLRRWMLATRDAHSLYAQYGFEAVDRPETLMWRRDPHVYARLAGEAA